MQDLIDDLKTSLLIVNGLLFSIFVVVAIFRQFFSPTSPDVAQPSGDKPHKTALLVTAHPDDECMFFTPTLLELKQKQYEIFLLCLSTGNYDGLGTIRAKELIASGKILSIPESHIQIVDHKELQDGMDNAWSSDLISRIAADEIERVHADLILTFDDYGVSGHPNHRAVSSGVCSLASRFNDRFFLQLESVSLLRKYSFVFDLPLSVLNDNFTWSAQLDVVHRCMGAHASQYVWFRRLFVPFSRYSYFNTWARA